MAEPLTALVDERLLELSPVHIEREGPIVVTSLSLGKMLTKAGVTIDFDYATITDVLHRALPENEVKQTTVTFTHNLPAEGEYTSGITDEPDGALHNIYIRLGRKQLENKKKGARIGAILAHEAQHAKDSSELGHEKASRRHRAWSEIFTGAMTGVGIVLPCFIGRVPLLSSIIESNTSPMKLALEGVTIAGMAIAGFSTAYLTNPSEIRARHAEKTAPKDAEIVRFIPVA